MSNSPSTEPFYRQHPLKTLLYTIVTFTGYYYFWLSKQRKDLNGQHQQQVPSVFYLLLPLMIMLAGAVVVFVALFVTAMTVPEWRLNQIAQTSVHIYAIAAAVTALAGLAMWIWWHVRFSRALDRASRGAISTEESTLALLLLPFAGHAIVQKNLNNYRAEKAEGGASHVAEVEDERSSKELVRTINVSLWRGGYYVNREKNRWTVIRVIDYDEVALHIALYDKFFDQKPTVDEVKKLKPFAGHTPVAIQELAIGKGMELLYHEPLKKNDIFTSGYAHYLEAMKWPADQIKEQLSFVIERSELSTRDTALVKIVNDDIATAEVILDTAATLKPAIRVVEVTHPQEGGVSHILTAEYRSGDALRDELAITYTDEGSVADGSPVVDIYAADENGEKVAFSMVVRDHLFYFLTSKERDGIPTIRRPGYRSLKVAEAEAHSKYPLVKAIMRELIDFGLLEKNPEYVADSKAGARSHVEKTKKIMLIGVGFAIISTLIPVLGFVGLVLGLVVLWRIYRSYYSENRQFLYQGYVTVLISLVNSMLFVMNRL